MAAVTASDMLTRPFAKKQVMHSNFGDPAVEPWNRRIASVFAVALLSACAAPYSKQATGITLPTAVAYSGDDSAFIAFSSDQKYKSKVGTPSLGDPLICSDSGVSRVHDDGKPDDAIRVQANKSIAVTSLIRLESAGWYKFCGSFVEFTPEQGERYIVVNERIGGFSTPIRKMSCHVSVYRETQEGHVLVQTQLNKQSARCAIDKGA